MAALKQNEQDMNALVTRLQKVIDEAAKAAEPAPAPKGAPASAPMGNLRGNLPWPANGPGACLRQRRDHRRPPWQRR